MFRFCFATVEREAALAAMEGVVATVFVLPARHGWLDPDTEIAPYEQTMVSAGAVTARQLADRLVAVVADHGADVIASCPRPTWLGYAAPST